MYNISSDDTRQTKSSRAGLLLHVGKMHRWMTLVKVGRFVHEMAAIYLTAGMETIMEDLVAKCLEAASSTASNSMASSNGNPGGSPPINTKISSSLLESTVAASSDYWGLFQPYSHLSSCRTANGLEMPRCLLELSSTSDPHGGRRPHGGPASGGAHPPQQSSTGKTLAQALLTTCVGSVEELEEMILMIGPVLRKAWQAVGSSTTGAGGAFSSNSSLSSATGAPFRAPSASFGIFGMKPNLLWNSEALRTLYHFVRCSQLEYVGQEGRLPIQVRL